MIRGRNPVFIAQIKAPPHPSSSILWLVWFLLRSAALISRPVCRGLTAGALSRAPAEAIIRGQETQVLGGTRTH